MVGHKWVWTEDVPRKIVQYNVDKPMDPDIVTSMANMKTQEGVHGKWNLSPDDWFQLQVDGKVNTDAESDPICSSAGCTQYKHKKKPLGYDLNYPVPNFGVDHDILTNHHSLDLAEKALSHKLVMATDASKAKWHNVAKDTDYNFAPKLDGDIRVSQKNLADSEANLGHKWVIDDLQIDSDMSSDPICSSAGCTQYKHKKKALGYDLNYPVPNFGVDHDILTNHHSLDLAEKALSHKLVMATEASKAKWHNVAKDTLYNFAPKLDGDIRASQKNLADSETNLGHKWVIDDLQVGTDLHTESDPICSSAGCPKSAWTEAEEAKIVQYPDPSLLDSDVRNTLKHEEAASTSVGHTWVPYGY